MGRLIGIGLSLLSRFSFGFQFALHFSSMSGEFTRGTEFSQAVADHSFVDEDFFKYLAIVN